MKGEASMRSTRRAVLRGAAALSLAGLDVLFAPWARANALRLGEPAPPATLVTLDGRRLATADLLGHVVILTFWATWCGPCREELPLLSSYATQHAARGLTVLGFGLDSPEDDLRKVRQVAHSLSFPVGLLANSSAAGYGRIWRIPVNFTIDRRGRLIDNGWKDKDSTWTAERLERIVTPLLNDPI
jgi:cytochrome c biogenesis protein CcmG, thiol:disulfide interchange protein DsbE